MNLLKLVHQDPINPFECRQPKEFVALFRRKGSVTVVWNQPCPKTSDEIVAEAVFVELNGHYLVSYAMVF
jgi:hypothetical protein